MKMSELPVRKVLLLNLDAKIERTAPQYTEEQKAKQKAQASEWNIRNRERRNAVNRERRALLRAIYEKEMEHKKQVAKNLKQANMTKGEIK